LKVAPRRFSPTQFQKTPLPKSSKTCSQSAYALRWVSKLLTRDSWPPTRGRIRTLLHSPFAGPSSGIAV
jgi:hypothetical protein